jgi:3-hydroxyisobutyrate dehydrogenase-like beta-hydroxyacid dehydrogenase
MTDQRRERSIGWIGAGRMGSAMATRLLEAGYGVAVYNRTRSKADALADLGATVVDSVAALAECDVVFTMVSASDDFADVTIGEGGVLRQDVAPAILVDCSTVSADVSAEVRAVADKVGTTLLVAPVSGNAKVVKSGKLSVVVSGPYDEYLAVEGLLQAFGRAVTYAGDGDVARVVKLAHNVFLGVVAQSLAEVTVLAEASGVARAAFLEFINDSVLGSTFTRYKSPAFVNLDFTPTFTSELLRKDFDLGLAAARQLEVPMPVAALAHQKVQEAIGRGYRDADFAALIACAAAAAGRELEPEDVEVSDGLEAS